MKENQARKMQKQHGSIATAMGGGASPDFGGMESNQQQTNQLLGGINKGVSQPITITNQVYVDNKLVQTNTQEHQRGGKT